MKEYNHKIVGNQVQKYRLAMKYSQERLAKLIGVSPSSISELERGGSYENSSISMENICNIAKALNVTLYDLAFTNLETINKTSNDLIKDMVQEMQTMSKKDLLLFSRIITIFIDSKNGKTNENK